MHPGHWLPAFPPACLQGGWVFLDNLHLMSGWVPTLERKLEAAAEGAHRDFRCFFSAEPIAGAPQARIIPESILQASCLLFGAEEGGVCEAEERGERNASEERGERNAYWGCMHIKADLFKTNTSHTLMHTAMCSPVRAAILRPPRQPPYPTNCHAHHLSCIF